MRWICCFLLACGAAIADEPSALTLPESDTFVVGEAYVIRSTSEITVLLKESPNFSLEKMPSPVAVYARVAGETTQRLQILDSPHIFFVTASQPGQTELIILAGWLCEQLEGGEPVVKKKWLGQVTLKTIQAAERE